MSKDELDALCAELLQMDDDYTTPFLRDDYIKLPSDTTLNFDSPPGTDNAFANLEDIWSDLPTVPDLPSLDGLDDYLLDQSVPVVERSSLEDDSIDLINLFDKDDFSANHTKLIDLYRKDDLLLDDDDLDFGELLGKTDSKANNMVASLGISDLPPNKTTSKKLALKKTGRRKRKPEELQKLSENKRVRKRVPGANKNNWDRAKILQCISSHPVRGDTRTVPPKGQCDYCTTKWPGGGQSHQRWSATKDDQYLCRSCYMAPNIHNTDSSGNLIITQRNKQIPPFPRGAPTKLTYGFKDGKCTIENPQYDELMHACIICKGGTSRHKYEFWKSCKHMAHLSCLASQFRQTQCTNCSACNAQPKRTDITKYILECSK